MTAQGHNLDHILKSNFEQDNKVQRTYLGSESIFEFRHGDTNQRTVWKKF